MTKKEAKQVLKYLENLTDKLTTKKEFDEMAAIMKLIEKEMENK